MKEMTKDAQEQLKAVNAAQNDWTATCRVCGSKLQGTLASLKEHKETCRGN